jgi:hypothetical protein
VVSTGDVMRAILPQARSSVFRRQQWRTFPMPRKHETPNLPPNCLRHAKSCASPRFDV